MIIMISDLHINDNTVNENLLVKLASFLDEQRIAHSSSVLFILGDIFDRHTDPERKITFKILDAVAEFFHSLQFDNIFLLKGNHDESFFELHNLNILSLDPRVMIIDSPRIINIESYKFFCIPFIKDYLHFQKVLETAPDDHIILMHQVIKGFKLNSRKISEDGAVIIRQFPLVVSGDLHDFQVKDKIVYIGSPYQIRRDEEPNKKAIVFDQNKVSFIDIPSTLSQRFIYVHNLDDIEAIAVEGKTIILTSDEIDIDKLELLRSKGIKIVSTSPIKKELETPNMVDLSGFSLDILVSVVENSKDQFARSIGEDLLHVLRSRSL